MFHLYSSNVLNNIYGLSNGHRGSFYDPSIEPLSLLIHWVVGLVKAIRFTLCVTLPYG